MKSILVMAAASVAAIAAAGALAQEREGDGASARSSEPATHAEQLQQALKEGSTESGGQTPPRVAAAQERPNGQSSEKSGERAKDKQAAERQENRSARSAASQPRSENNGASSSQGEDADGAIREGQQLLERSTAEIRRLRARYAMVAARVGEAATPAELREEAELLNDLAGRWGAADENAARAQMMIATGERMRRAERREAEERRAAGSGEGN